MNKGYADDLEYDLHVQRLLWVTCNRHLDEAAADLSLFHEKGQNVVGTGRIGATDAAMVLRRWVEDGCRKSEDEITEIIAKCIPPAFRSLRK